MRRLIFLTLLATFCISCGSSSSYDTAVNKKLRRVLGHDQSRDYKWLSYPVTNFGVLTAYDRIGTHVDVSDKHFICDTWNCVGLDPATLSPEKQLSVDGYASVFEGPPIRLVQGGSTKRAITINAVDLFAAVPEVAAELSDSRLLLTEVRCNRIYRRVLRRDRFTRSIEARPETDALKRAFTSGRLILVIGDIVIDGLTAKVTVESDASPKFDIALTKLVTAGFAVKRSGNTVYEIQAEKPVVAARLLARVPGDQRSAFDGPDDWSDWLVPRDSSRSIGTLAATQVIPDH